MGTDDQYQSSMSKSRGRMSFGDQAYTDSFTRTETQSLATKKRTAALDATSELAIVLTGQVASQLQTCRIILDKFEQRMKILKWAQVTADTASSARSSPKFTDATEARASKRRLFGRGKSSIPPLNQRQLPSRGERGKAGVASKAGLQVPGTILGPQEQALGLTISRAIAKDPELHRRVQVAVYQFAVASEAVVEAERILLNVGLVDPKEGVALLDALDIAKVQGKIYPICNFHEVFKLDTELARLFPTPTRPGKGA